MVFIEPYDKSRALALHEDSLAVEGLETSDKVSLEPFVGVAPRRYLEMFDAAARKRLGHLARRDADGNAEAFVKAEASPVFADGGPTQLMPELPAYRAKELMALAHFHDLSAEGRAE